MRNPLARLAQRDPSKPSLKQRLAATREKYARTLRVHRALNGPLPKPEPVDRVALVNYASWLFMERRLVCAELYPHAGVKAASFVMAAGAADRFHFPRDVPRDASTAALKPSTRAVKVLDTVGVDWRADLPEREHLDDPSMQDIGVRPTLPHGWPRLDAALLEALDDLSRLDAAQGAMHGSGFDDGRDADTVPGYADLDDARDDALARLAKDRATSLIGLQAKARALLTRTLAEVGGEPFEAIASSLARDLIGATQSIIEPQPDPIFPAIEEARRLYRELDAARAVPPPPACRLMSPAHVAARNAFSAHCDGVLLKTVPTTAAGCAALARYAIEYQAAEGSPLGEDNDGENVRILGSIAKSPML